MQSIVGYNFVINKNPYERIPKVVVFFYKKLNDRQNLICNHGKAHDKKLHKKTVHPKSTDKAEAVAKQVTPLRLPYGTHTYSFSAAVFLL